MIPRLLFGLFALGCVAASEFAARSVAAEVTLVQDGVAQVFIQVSPRVWAGDHKFPAGTPAAETAAEHARQRLREAACDLARCLEKISGASVAVVTNPPANAARPLVPILIGELATARFGPPAKISPHQQGWRLVASAQGIGLLGESDEAASCAVYELLDRLGCRWFLPGELGEVLPEARTIRLAAADDSGVPA